MLEQDYASLHNVLLAHFLSTGESLAWKWADLVQLRMSTPIDALVGSTHRGVSESSTTAPSNRKPSALSQLAHFKPSNGSKLDPHGYPRDSIEASLAALGPVHPLSWYNLVILQTTRNQNRLALKTCDDILDALFPALVELNHILAIKIGIIFLYIVIKLNYSNHPKHTLVLTDVEKVIIHRLAATKGPGTFPIRPSNYFFFFFITIPY
jgi:hypothetical protein